MTAKDFRAVAEIIRHQQSNSQDAEILRELLAKDFARYFASVNERFDRQRFLAACDVKRTD
jgi:hypothetical protein